MRKDTVILNFENFMKSSIKFAVAYHESLLKRVKIFKMSEIEVIISIEKKTLLKITIFLCCELEENSKQYAKRTSEKIFSNLIKNSISEIVTEYTSFKPSPQPVHRFLLPSVYSLPFSQKQAPDCELINEEINKLID